MIIDGIDFHNVNYKKWDKEEEGWLLSRIEKDEIEQINEIAQRTSFYNCGIELRFFLESDEVNLYFSRVTPPENVNSQGIAVIFQGDFQASYELNPQYISKNSKITIKKKYLKNRNLIDKSTGFNSELVRVILPYDWSHCYLGMDGKVRTPSPADYPQKNIFFYGSSIVHGGSASISTNSYAFKVAQKLNWDYRNLGFAGSCFLDEVMAQKIKAEQWDLLLMELGGNVLDWEEEKFAKKVKRFLAIVSQTKNQGPIYCIGLFRRITDLDLAEKNKIFREILKKEASKYNQMKYLDGLEMLTEWRGLSSDGIHPSDYGMNQIAENIVVQLSIDATLSF